MLFVLLGWDKGKDVMSPEEARTYDVEVSRANVISIREYLEAILHERLRSTDERFRASEVAVREALAAADKAVMAALQAQQRESEKAFIAAEKAIVKAEAAQSLFNQMAIDTTGKLDEQAKQFITRIESLSTTKALEEKADSLRLLFDSRLESQRLASVAASESIGREITSLRASMTAFITKSEHDAVILRIGTLETRQATMGTSQIQRGEITAIQEAFTVSQTALATRASSIEISMVTHDELKAAVATQSAAIEKVSNAHGGLEDKVIEGTNQRNVAVANIQKDISEMQEKLRIIGEKANQTFARNASIISIAIAAIAVAITIITLLRAVP